MKFGIYTLAVFLAVLATGLIAIWSVDETYAFSDSFSQETTVQSDDDDDDDGGRCPATSRKRCDGLMLKRLGI